MAATRISRQPRSRHAAEHASGAWRALPVRRGIVGEERINALSARLKLLSRHRFTLVETVALIVLHAAAMTALFRGYPVPAATRRAMRGVLSALGKPERDK